jgi:exodeoxyribonuclease-3
VDAYRLLNPQGQKYTYWSYIFQARPKNIGWRIDYIFVDARLKLIKADVHDDIMGSDHCPVSVTIQLA